MFLRAQNCPGLSFAATKRHLRWRSDPQFSLSRHANTRASRADTGRTNACRPGWENIKVQWIDQQSPQNAELTLGGSTSSRLRGCGSDRVAASGREDGAGYSRIWYPVLCPAVTHVKLTRSSGGEGGDGPCAHRVERSPMIASRQLLGASRPQGSTWYVLSDTEPGLKNEIKV